jgi:predicted ATPase
MIEIMRIGQVSFTGFKSLYDLTLPLGDLTVITGPNNAGKSNLLAGLSFLGQVYAAGLDSAMERFGGYDRIAFRRSGEAVPSVGLKLEADLERAEVEQAVAAVSPSGKISTPDALRVEHNFRIAAEGQGPVSSYELKPGYVRTTDESGRQWPQIFWTGDEQATPERDFGGRLLEGISFAIIEPSDSSFLERRKRDRSDALKSLMDLAMVYSLPGVLVKHAVSTLAVVRPTPQVCRGAGVPGPNVLLGAFGENLPAVADHLRRVDSDAWTRVQEAMSTVVPGLTGIEVVPTEDRLLALRFHERGVLRPWSAGEVSDGTIQALALIVALFDRRIPLLAVEEPENALHPWILREFVDLCRAQPAKQVVLTTHSPVLIDYVPADVVTLMWRADGKSQAGRMVDLDPDVKKLWERGEVSLFEMYDSGAVPPATPGAGA